jgi:hypothetical protein
VNKWVEAGRTTKIEEKNTNFVTKMNKKVTEVLYVLLQTFIDEKYSKSRKSGFHKSTCRKSRVYCIVILSITVEPGYNDIGLRDTLSITTDILWCQLFPRC